MNVEERIKQCNKDIEALKMEKKKLEEQKKKSETVPIISFATLDYPDDRVVINLNERMIECVKRGAKQLVVAKNGIVGDNKYNYKLSFMYENQKPIFGELKNE